MQLWIHKFIHASAKAHSALAALRREDVRSVAVIKHAALGEQVLARPFLTEVRRQFPNAQITLGAIANYVHGLPTELVDRVHVAAGQFRPRPPFRERLRTYRELGYHDLIFDITGSSASMWITAVNPARVKFGYRHHPLSPLVYDVTIPRAFMSFEAETYLHLLAILRVRYAWPLDYGYPAGTAATDPPYLAYFPTSTAPERNWPPERYGALMARLAAALPDHEHRLLYGVQDWEVETAERALAVAGDAPNIKAERDVKGDAFQAFVQGATLLVATDTGVRHLAIGLGTPTVGVFPTSLAYTWWPRFGHHDVVHGAERGPPPVDAVYDAVLRLLDAVRRDPRR